MEHAPAQSRGLLKRGLIGKSKQTVTTTTTPPNNDEPEYDDEEEFAELEGEVQSESTSEIPTSTEGKKIKAGIVRPFRSNDDLLAALKRRRIQASSDKSHKAASNSEPDSVTDAPQKTNSKKSFARGEKPASDDSQPPAKPSRGRFSSRTSRISQPESESLNPELGNDAAPQVSRPGRNYLRRGGN